LRPCQLASTATGLNAGREAYDPSSQPLFLAMDRIRFAIKHTEQFGARTDQMRGAGLQLLDALERLESVEFLSNNGRGRDPPSPSVGMPNGNGKGSRPFPRTLTPLAASFLRCAPVRFLLTKPNTSPTSDMPASLRSDDVRVHPGMPLGFPSESAFGFAGILNGGSQPSHFGPIGAQNGRAALLFCAPALTALRSRKETVPMEINAGRGAMRSE
jgi:hypothetical protein